MEHKQIPKRYLTDGTNYHDTQHIKTYFLVFGCAKKTGNLAQNDNFSISSIFWHPFLLP